MESIFSKTRIIALLALCMLVASVGMSATFYVDPAGDDVLGDGSAGNPYATIQRGASAAMTAPGDDTVAINSGTYGAGAVVGDDDNIVFAAGAGGVTVNGGVATGHSSGATANFMITNGAGLITLDGGLDGMALTGADWGVTTFDLAGSTGNVTVNNCDFTPTLMGLRPILQGAFTVTNCTITGGARMGLNADGSGTILNMSDTTVTNTGGPGLRVTNAVTAVFDTVSVTGCGATYPTNPDTSLSIHGMGCQVWIEGGAYNVTMTDCAINGSGRIGIYSNSATGTLNVNGGSITGAGNWIGAIMTGNGTFNFDGINIHDNATNGFFLWQDASVTISNCTIANLTGGEGRPIWNNFGTPVTVNNTTMTDCTGSLEPGAGLTPKVFNNCTITRCGTANVMHHGCGQMVQGWGAIHNWTFNDCVMVGNGVQSAFFFGTNAGIGGSSFAYNGGSISGVGGWGVMGPCGGGSAVFDGVAIGPTVGNGMGFWNWNSAGGGVGQIASLTVTDCTYTGISAGVWAINADFGIPSINISNNTFLGNNNNVQIVTNAAVTANVTNNSIDGGRVGIALTGTAGPTTANIVHNFIKPAYGDGVNRDCIEGNGQNTTVNLDRNWLITPCNTGSVGPTAFWGNGMKNILVTNNVIIGGTHAGWHDVTWTTGFDRWIGNTWVGIQDTAPGAIDSRVNIWPAGAIQPGLKIEVRNNVTYGFWANALMWGGAADTYTGVNSNNWQCPVGFAAGTLPDFMWPSTGLPTAPAQLAQIDPRLRPTSPLIDAGVVVANIPALDWDGNPRVCGGAPDIGAFEFAPHVVSITRTVGAAENTQSRSLSFKVEFDWPVTGVDATDFDAWGDTADYVADAAPVAGKVYINGEAIKTFAVTEIDPKTYTVVMTTIGGTGTIGLRLADNDSIKAGTVPLKGLNTDAGGDGSTNSTETYTITDTAAPNLMAINLADGSPTSRNAVRFQLVFDEAMNPASIVPYSTGLAATLTKAQDPMDAAIITITATMDDPAANGVIDAGTTGGTDYAGLALATNFSSANYTIDNLVPIVLGITRTTDGTVPGSPEKVFDVAEVQYTVAFDMDVDSYTDVANYNLSGTFKSAVPATAITNVGTLSGTFETIVTVGLQYPTPTPSASGWLRLDVVSAPPTIVSHADPTKHLGGPFLSGEIYDILNLPRNPAAAEDWMLYE